MSGRKDPRMKSDRLAMEIKSLIAQAVQVCDTSCVRHSEGEFLSTYEKKCILKCLPAFLDNSQRIAIALTDKSDIQHLRQTHVEDHSDF